MLLTLFILLFHGATSSGFVPGRICDHVNAEEIFNVTTGMTTSSALSNKHLRVVLLDWAPFAKYDASKLGNEAWSGVDVELMQIISGRLNFTYEFVPMVREANETWTQTLTRHVRKADLVCSYWMSSKDRRMRMYMLNGHIDSSVVLAVPPVHTKTQSFFERSLTFLQPYDWSAWVGILGVCLLSGIGYYLLEGLSQGDVYPFESFYEQLNVLIFHENPAPKSTLARLHAPAWGIVAVVILSVYTAKMSSFMTLWSLPVSKITSMESVASLELPICMYNFEPLKALILQQHPTITSWVKCSSYLDAGLAMMGLNLDASVAKQGCDAMILPRVEARELKTDRAMCGMSLAGEPLIPNEAGWVTNVMSPCVATAVETELQDLYVNGVVSDLMDKHRPTAICTGHQGSKEAQAVDIKDIAGIFIAYLSCLALLLVTKWIFGCVQHTNWYKALAEAKVGRGFARTLSKKLFRMSVRQEMTLETLMEKLEKMESDILELQPGPKVPQSLQSL